MRNYKETDTKNNGAPAWMTTYGDMVTLLLTFFVMLFSFSTIDATKWQELVAALSGNPGIMEGGKTIDEFPLENSSLIAEQLKSMEEIDDFERLYISLKEYIEENELDAYVEISKSETEILIRFLDNILFQLGKAEIKEEALTILDKVSNALHEYQETINMVRIEGHTDNLPINTVMFPSNWELSVARAVNVLKYLLDEKGMSPSKISAVGYGEYHPIADNDTDEGRSKNRRVEFVIARSLPEQNY